MSNTGNQQQAVQDGASSKPGRMYKYRRWLGYWNPGLNSIKTETELALHVSFAHSASEQHQKRDRASVACKHCTLSVQQCPLLQMLQCM